MSSERVFSVIKNVLCKHSECPEVLASTLNRSTPLADLCLGEDGLNAVIRDINRRLEVRLSQAWGDERKYRTVGSLVNAVMAERENASNHQGEYPSEFMFA